MDSERCLNSFKLFENCSKANLITSPVTNLMSLNPVNMQNWVPESFNIPKTDYKQASFNVGEEGGRLVGWKYFSLDENFYSLNKKQLLS